MVTCMHGAAMSLFYLPIVFHKNWKVCKGKKHTRNQNMCTHAQSIADSKSIGHVQSKYANGGDRGGQGVIRSNAGGDKKQHSGDI